MPALPEGEPAPADGALPDWVGGGEPVGGGRAFGVYVHIPFCAVRCGYCDFNTYTAAELGGGASQSSYASTALKEVELAARVLARAGLGGRPVSTVFFGGGTPTILPVTDLARLLDGVRSVWGLAPDAEVTTEANPDSVTPESLEELAAAGFTRVSFGMQSAVPHVLATLDRTHDPRRIPDVVRSARDAGLAVSLDLIYGTPGESVDDWQVSLDAVLATGVDHVSAYALTVEPGTRMGAQVRRGELAPPSDDDQAEKYEIADATLRSGGLEWYEVSNWARTEAHRSRHNLAYWRSDDWWGIGPGAHSYIGASAGRQPGVADGVVPHGDGASTDSGSGSKGGLAGARWWNVKSPRRYAALLAEGSPAAGRELLTAADGALETVMLRTRLREGIESSMLSAGGRRAIPGLIADGLIDGRTALAGRVVLTLRGRLLADTVVGALTAETDEPVGSEP